MTTAPTPAPPPSSAERRELGRRARKIVPRSALGEWTPRSDRDPLAQLRAQEVTRVAELVPIRHQRMAVSPFTFFRGAAAVFASDLADGPRTDLDVQLCGDAHLTNFGGFASPERRLVFDLNDFDETLPGPFEWDLKRLAASFEVAGRENGFEERERRTVQRSLGRTYASSMARFSSMSHLDIWYAHLGLDELDEHLGGELPSMRARVDTAARKARGKDRLKALRKLTTVRDGEPRFSSDPPLLEPVGEVFSAIERQELVDSVAAAFTSYRQTLQRDRRTLLERYRFVDLARKVVGVGSVGTRCWVALLMGKDDEDPLFLQVKEAEASVLEPHLGPSEFAQHGQRVVEGQRLMQAASDIFLGWSRLRGADGRDHDYYFRQLWDWKVSPDVDGMDPGVLERYAQLCAHTLARAHARSGDAVALSAYVGGGKSLGKAMSRFASLYADQNERDHEAFVAAVATTDVRH